MNLVFNDKTYIRDGHPDQYQVEEELCKLYGVKNALMSPSGLSAISAVFHGFIHSYPSGEIWYSSELYGETLRLIKSLPCNKFSCDDLTEIRAKDKIILIFFESCSNPSGRIPNFEYVSEIRKSNLEVFFVIDNTWLSSVIFNPFQFDVDLVVVSLTKCYSGGKAIGGAFLSDHSELFISALDYSYINGLHISPYNCEVIRGELTTVRNRIIKTSNLTYEFLQKYPNMTIYHPYMCQRPFVHMYFNKADGRALIPSVLFFKSPHPKEHLSIPEKTSYGGPDHRVEFYDRHNKLHVRLALGYNDPLDTTPWI